MEVGIVWMIYSIVINLKQFERIKGKVSTIIQENKLILENHAYHHQLEVTEH